ncbi:MAG: reverse transcriptase family protein, partial [Nitrospira sp.]|nr:reverse transcriptase family protein [Nitrospira sp.]
MKNTRANEWKKFVNLEGNTDPWGSVYKICREKRKREVMAGIEVNGRVHDTWKESMEALLGEFFPAVPGENIEEERTEEPEVVESITSKEVANAVKRVKLRKAPGLDKMNGEIVKRMWGVIPKCMISLMDECLKEGYFPNEWKRGRVIVLLKSPDKVRTGPRSYRPVCLLPVLAKVLERVMVDRLERVAAATRSDCQYGFRTGRGVEGAWHYAQSIVSASECKYVLGIFVDFKGAFDNLLWSQVLSRMKELGCRELDLWKSYFCNRSVCVAGANETVWRTVEKGCPQGSVCGPYVWNTMIDVLLNSLSRAGCKVVAFADDLLILVDGDRRLSLEESGEEWMRMVVCWGNRVGVTVSESKTVCMMLKGQLSMNRSPCVRINGKGIRYVRNVKYLEVNMSERMNFKLHLERVLERTVGLVGMMRRVLRKEWGVNRRIMKIWYKSLFIPIVMFGSSVWFECMGMKYAVALINKCQRQVMYAGLNVCRTVSTEAMQVLIGDLPWDLEVVRRGTVYMIKKGH